MIQNLLLLQKNELLINLLAPYTFTLKLMTSGTLELVFIYATILNIHFLKYQAILHLPNIQIPLLPTINSLRPAVADTARRYTDEKDKPPVPYRRA